MESNITLRSNVYINKSGRRNDLDFVHHIRDYSSLSRYYDPVYRTSEVPLTEVQREILQQGTPKCSWEKGTMSFGVPIGSDRFVCRCEEKECIYYSKCSAGANFERIIRNPEEEEKPKELTEPENTEEIPQETAEAELLPKEPKEEKNDILPAKEQEPAPAEIKTSVHPPKSSSEPAPDLRRADKRTGISYSSQEAVIEADIHTRIWVNAGPGTGKTYTVIKRLCRLLKEGNSNKAILVLCFSKNAVQVIRERLYAEIGSRIDSLLAEERLIIRTFDSFATYMLEDDLPKGLDYDQRIELFIEKIAENAELLDSVDYLIVDEVQDTVGVRARMLQSMIEPSNFGVLLLGDRCQAIYDWAVRGSNDWISKDLFDWVSGQGFQICELDTNHRQGQDLSKIGDTLRKSFLDSSEDEQEQTLTRCKEKIETLWPGYKMQELPKKLFQKSELILCKTNGEAAVVSDLLFGGDEFVEHTIMQGTEHKSLAPWIGMTLGGCTDPVVSRDDFIARAQEHQIEDIETKWDALMSLDTHTRSAVLHRQEVLKRLSAMEALPEICLNQPGDGVIVSTIHRAKGSEADHVYWVDSPLLFDKQSQEEGAKADALKASYVAVTRAKEDIRMIYPEQKSYMRSISGDRWIKLEYKASRTPTCTRISLQPDDVNMLSCVSGTDFQQIQELIATLTPGIDLKLYPTEDGTGFDIFYDGFQIGQTSNSFRDALQTTLQQPNIKYQNCTPHDIDSVYVSSLITIIQMSGTKGENAYQTSGCWLGFELGGFANINYI